MALYHFRIEEHIRDDMYKSYFVDIELTDLEFDHIRSDDSRYSRASALVSSKLGFKVRVLQFPYKIK